MKYKNDIAKQELVIKEALDIIASRLKSGDKDKSFTSSKDTKNYLSLKMATLENEHFKVLFMNTQHELLADETLFTGTIDGAAVYPREILKAALKHNAAAVILAHNHPSGHAEPSQADRRITKMIVEALALIDVKVLDHIIVGKNETVSFSERGIL